MNVALGDKCDTCVEKKNFFRPNLFKQQLSQCREVKITLDIKSAVTIRVVVLEMLTSVVTFIPCCEMNAI